MLRHPAPLEKGDFAALTAPASPVSETVLSAAADSLEFLGLKPIVMPSCRMADDYLAGSDAQRAEDLNRSFADPAIRGIFCIRGGYGSARILPLLDLEVIRNNPKTFIGYSDITALHTAFNQICGFVTFHGPMPGENYALLDTYSLESLKRSLFFPKAEGEIANPPGKKLQTLFAGQAEGILTGGNLTVLQSTLGSRYEVDTKGKILFLEDTGESPYRLDRALTSLALAGKLRDCSGILLGTFTNCRDSSPEHTAASPQNCAAMEQKLKERFCELLAPWEKPVAFHMQAGHIASQCTLPFGARVFLNASKQGASLFYAKK